MYLTDKVILVELGGGQFRQSIALKPVAVLQNGSLVAMQTDFADSGDGTRKPDGTEVTKTVGFVTDGTDGYLSYAAEDGVFDDVGGWQVKAFLSKTGAELTSDTLKFSVEAR